MKRVLLSILMLLAAACTAGPNAPTIEYQGEHFRLTRTFNDYDEYKNAPDNIDPSEFPRIEAKILSIQIPKEFKTGNEFFLETLKIKFPGFGFGGLDSKENIRNATIQIPGGAGYRYITAIEKNGRWQVVDDFKGPVPYGGSSVEIEGKKLIYKTHKGEEFRAKILD